MNIKRDSIESNTIDLLRFVMACLVVMMHAAIGLKISEASGTPLLCFNYLSLSEIGGGKIVYVTICRLLSQLAVPAFFFISGYFFFNKYREQSVDVYKAKIETRIKSIVIPYIVWNVLLLCIAFVLGVFLQGVSLSSIFESNGGLRVFWDCGRETTTANILGIDMPRDRCPIDGPLWFVRDLIMLSLISPVILLLIKYTAKIGLIVMSILMLLNIWLPFTFVTSVGFFFFWLGAFFQVNEVTIFSVNRNRMIIQHVLTALILVVAILVYGHNDTADYYLYRLFTIFGIFSLFDIALWIVRRYNIKPVRGLSECSFFMYAAHQGIILIAIQKTIQHLPVDESPVIEWLLVSVITIGFFTITYYILKKYLPALLSVLTGGR